MIYYQCIYQKVKNLKEKISQNLLFEQKKYVQKLITLIILL